ncbi:hypothetical protein GCM10009634_36440 [Saccharothrix xinjiangensis]
MQPLPDHPAALAWLDAHHSHLPDPATRTQTHRRLGRAHAALGQCSRTCAAWQEALALYRQQNSGADAERVQRQLDDLDLDLGPAQEPGRSTRTSRSNTPIR